MLPGEANFGPSDDSRRRLAEMAVNLDGYEVAIFERDAFRNVLGSSKFWTER